MDNMNLVYNWAESIRNSAGWAQDAIREENYEDALIYISQVWGMADAIMKATYKEND